MRQFTDEMHVGFIDLFHPTLEAMKSPGSDLTSNGVHLNDEGYALFAKQANGFEMPGHNHHSD